MTVKIIQFIALQFVLLQTLNFAFADGGATTGQCGAQFPRLKELTRCCSFPFITDDGIVKACMEEHKGKSDKDVAGGHGSSLGYCLAVECIFNATKIADGDGGFDEARWHSEIKEITADHAEWFPILNPLVNSCIVKANEKVVTAYAIAKGKCNPKYLEATRCVYQGAFLGCPPSSYTSSSECDAVKEHIENCFAE